MKATPILMTLGLIAGLVLSPEVFAQTAGEYGRIDERLTAVEEFARKVGPALDDLSRQMSESVQMRVRSLTGQVVVLEPFSQKVKKIETNTGSFLIFVRKVQKLEDGYRLRISMGNPSLATYTGATLHARWGREWAAGGTQGFEDWRASLIEAEYRYDGDFMPGTWTEVVLDLVPAQRSQIEYIECELDIGSVSLKQPAPSGDVSQ